MQVQKCTSQWLVRYWKDDGLGNVDVDVKRRASRKNSSHWCAGKSVNRVCQTRVGAHFAVGVHLFAGFKNIPFAPTCLYRRQALVRPVPHLSRCTDSFRIGIGILPVWQRSLLVWHKLPRLTLSQTLGDIALSNYLCHRPKTSALQLEFPYYMYSTPSLLHCTVPLQSVPLIDPVQGALQSGACKGHTHQFP